ncbi:hypothetical protein AAMO2058_001217600 [Amorphochlora amoebiformis]
MLRGRALTGATWRGRKVVKKGFCEGKAIDVVGCGSNVVDTFFKVRAMPEAGSKTYFADAMKTLEEVVVGGVTLNHLAWAHLFGTSTGLMALQGYDANGELIRDRMDSLGVSKRYIDISHSHATSACHILLDPDGERAIIMAPASTSKIDSHAAKKYFELAIKQAKIVTTEISQVPLTGVQRLLDMSKEHGKLSMLDVDVPPSVAATSANLGTLSETLQVVSSADILKPTIDAAPELLALAATNGQSCDPRDSGIAVSRDLREISERLLETFGARMVAVTDGKNGCGLSVEGGVTEVIPGFPGVKQIDSTGAGDAFFGGLVAGIERFGIPKSREDLQVVGSAASAAGAACVEILGGLPIEESRSRMVELAPDAVSQLSKPPSQPSKLRTELDVDVSAGTSSLTRDCESLEILRKNGISGDFGALCRECGEAEKKGGRVLVTGIGKSGYVGRRLSASLASIGIPSHFIHASEWLHGDLGNAQPGDVVLIISNSGNSPELIPIPPLLQKKGVVCALLAGKRGGNVETSCDLVVIGVTRDEGEILGKVPAGSIVVQEAMCNAIIAQLVETRQTDLLTFAENHPGGNLGKTLA